MILRVLPCQRNIATTAVYHACTSGDMPPSFEELPTAPPLVVAHFNRTHPKATKPQANQFREFKPQLER